MSRSAFIVAVLSILAPAGCARQPSPQAASADAPRPSDPSPSAEENDSCPYKGKTVLYYEGSHGNEIDFYDPSGRYFLWYPGNRTASPGNWHVEAQRICFHYDDEHYNPVTAEYTEWDCWSLPDLSQYVVDAVPGDVFGLATGRVPFRLPAHARFDSIADVKASTE